MGISKQILILGANSDMARAIAFEFARSGWSLYLASRNLESLQLFGEQLRQDTGAEIDCGLFEAEAYESHKSFYEGIRQKPDVVVYAAGYLGDQELGRSDWSEAKKVLSVNYVGAVSILNIVANDFEKRNSGCMVGISSVAGERGRSSNYLYGSSKAAFTAYLSGLRSRLTKSQVNVITVKPGFVRTKMITGMATPNFLTTSPEHAGKRIFQAVQKKQDVIYIGRIWWIIMLIIKCLPEGIFKKLNF